MTATHQLNTGLDSFLHTDVPLFECCSCQRLLHEPVLLNCLHNYCRSCIGQSSHRVHMLKLIVKCCVCFEVTELNEVTTNSFLLACQRSCALFSESVRCNACNAEKEPAEFWCVDCCQGLCASCYSSHNVAAMRHRSAELEVARTWSLSQRLRTVGHCSEHKLQMVAVCFICCMPKCPECCTICKDLGHDMRPLSHDKTLQHLCRVIDAIICTRERLNHLLCTHLRKRRETASRLRAACTASHKLLVKHRNRLSESAVNAFDRSVSEVCASLERIWYECPGVRVRAVWSLCAENIDALCVGDFRSEQFLQTTRLLKAIALQSAPSCKASIRRLRQSWKQSGESISVDGAAPLTADIVLSGCLGATACKQAPPQAPLVFGQSHSVTFRAPVDCWDLAVTRGGHVLLAALQHGLLVYSDRGQQLSSWRPERQSDGRDDRVYCVAALSDGRAAVGVFYAELVVLLRLSQKGDTWQEDRRVAVLPSPPRRLAVHGDLLAAAERRYDKQKQLWVTGREVKLLRMSSGLVLYTDSRDYDIRKVALTALCVVTSSLRPVKRNSGVTPYVLEAFSHSGEFLWCYETSDHELLDGVCVSADTWSRLYVAVVRRDGSSSRVMAICGADGRGSRDVMSSTTHGLQRPVWLSLARGRQRTVLAVVSKEKAAEQGAAAQYRTVSLYEAKME